eukprot:scaffold22382_cov83-Skeletonema_dohrnii-CCMP3373.AAC.2
METIGTKGSNDASIQSAPFLLPKRSFLRYNAARPSFRSLEIRSRGKENRRIYFCSKGTKWLLQLSEVIEIRN